MEICFDTIQDQLAKHVDLAKIVDFNALSQKPGFKIEQCNSWIYIGQMMNGKKNGTGILKIVDSLKLYIGEWVVDQKQGLGYEKFSNGAEYYGSYENNKQNGYGEYFWVNGEIYKGHWIDGQKSGYGEWLGQNSWYKGEWKMAMWKEEGYINLKKVYHVSNLGDLYTGDFVASMKHGMGEERFSNGDLFRGNFINGKPEGYGEYVWKSGSLYQGFFLKGMRHGQGVWQSSTSSLCDKYDGAYQFDKNQDTVNLFGLMELFIKANFKMILGRVMEKFILKGFQFIKGMGKGCIN